MTDEIMNALEILLPDLCSTDVCVNTPGEPDSLGFLWCKDCSERRYLMEWGYAHDWPALDRMPYALAAGIGYWCTTAFMGDDDRVVALLAAIEEYIPESVRNPIARPLGVSKNWRM